MNQALRLIHTTTPPHVARQRDPALEVYERWKLLLRAGRPVARNLSAERRALLEGVMARWGFDVDVMCMAVEGCFASQWVRERLAEGKPFDELGFIFGAEERVERFAALGQRAREQAERAQQEPAPAPVVATGPTPAAPVEPMPADVRARLLAMKAHFAKRRGL